MSRSQAGQKPSVGAQPARYRFFLNPYTDCRFTSCPQCGAKMHQKKLPLVIHVQPQQVISLNKTCRYCPRCDLLIAHQDEVEAFLASFLTATAPEVIGNEYLVLGTMDRPDWQRGTQEQLSLEEMLRTMHEFKEYVQFEVEAPGWVPQDDAVEEPRARPRTPTRDRAGEPEAATRKRAPSEQSGSGERPAAGAADEAARLRQSVPVRLRDTYDQIVARTDKVCREHLNEEYAQLSRRLAAALCRKRPSPVVKGRVDGWAAGVVHAIGAVNFLFDPSQTPHFKATELAALFDVSPATASARASEIRRLFDLHHFSVEWCLPSLLDQNPFAWLISVDGIPVDARHAPREVQEEALRRGLIPYLPETHDEWDAPWPAPGRGQG
jgi:hypothetical protein